MIGRSVSHYKILERVGGGGMGVVYRAEDTKLRRTVALKFLPHELGGDEVAKKRFMREAQAASALDHPNICNIYEIDETSEGQLFIAMAYYDGDSLKELVAKDPLGVREAFEIGMAVAQGLSRAHKSGIVHRDIKPANVMITRDGFVKLVDFGLAKLEGATKVTKSQFTVGTVSYMSPEQAAGEHVDERTDIWALGVVMYEMLSGSTPWQGSVDQAIIYSIMSQDPTPLREVVPEVPQRLSDAVLKCLAKDPKERYQTVDELIADLGDVARELGWGSSVVARSVAPIARSKHRKWPRVVGIAAAAVVVVAAGVFAWQRWGPQAERSVYVTENRIAVLPLTNMMGIAQSDFSNGLSEVICFLAEEATRKNESTWVVPYDKVVAAPIAKPQDAIGAFGINQVVIGNVQRFADQHRLSLQLCNAQDLSVIRSTNLDYDAKTCDGLPDSLAQRVAMLLDADTADPDRMATYLPTDPTAMRPYCDGLALMQNDPHGAHLDAAISSLQSATTIDPNFPMGQATLGRAYTTRFQLSRDTAALDTAKTHLDRALSATPDNVYSNIYAARVYFWMELYPEAIERCKTALAVAPGQPLATRALAWSYNSQDRFDEGESAFLAAIRHAPDYWATHFELGVFRYYRGRERAGLDQWREALRYASEDVTTLNNIGAIYQRDGEWHMARQYFERAYQINRTCQTCQNMGLVSYFEENYEEAAKYYTFALEYCDTTKYNTWGNLAGAQYYAEGQRDRSVATYRAAIRHALKDLAVQPEEPAVIAALIEYYTMSGDWDHGFQMIAYGDSVAGSNPVIAFFTGDAYERHGQRSTALRYLGNAIRLGYPIVEIERTPSLRDLVQDPVFKRMISEEATGQRTPSTDAPSN